MWFEQSVPRDHRLSVKEVAEYLGASGRTVRWWAATGRLPATRVRIKIWSFRSCDVEAFSLRLGFRQVATPAEHGGRRV